MPSTATGKAITSMEEYISVETLRAAGAGESAPVVIDVRGSDEYRVGHLPGALHSPAEELRGRTKELPRDRPLVTSRNMRHRRDSRGERAASLLRENGVPARALEGGFPGCAAARYSVECG